MKSIAAALTSILLPLAALAGQASQASADALLSQIHADGPSKVLSRLWDKPGDFDRVAEAIASGDPDWLRLAAELRGAADGAASLSLDYAVARAIPSNPTGVLALVSKGFPQDMICTSPFIEPEPGVAEDYERRALSALESVKGSLAPAAARCAAGIRLPKGS